MDDEHKRMCWASRRGMLELDLILEPFVRDFYAGLDTDDRERYRDLMGCQDQELFTWFLKRETPPDPRLAEIVAKILASRRN
jgi:antitoxin CptB